MSKTQAYYVVSGYDCDDIADEYQVLKGPDGFECVITEPEDRSFYRDLRCVVEELNRLHRIAWSERPMTGYERILVSEYHKHKARAKLSPRPMASSTELRMTGSLDMRRELQRKKQRHEQRAAAVLDELRRLAKRGQ